MGLCELLNITVTELTKERVVMDMPITVGLYQPHGFVHGGATIALLESAASAGAQLNCDLSTHLPFGVDVHIKYRKSGQFGILHGVAVLDRQEISEYSGALKQFWNVAAYDDEGDVVSEGVIETKIVSREYLAAKNRVRENTSSDNAVPI